MPIGGFRATRGDEGHFTMADGPVGEGPWRDIGPGSGHEVGAGREAVAVDRFHMRDGSVMSGAGYTIPLQSQFTRFNDQIG